jgi:hypothetical protein
MGVLRTIGRTGTGLGRRLALRSKWLARRLWMVMVADALLTGRRHWKRLDDEERSRLLALARKSKGRPDTNLSAAERSEANRLLHKLGHIELTGELAEIVLPFKPLSRIATRIAVGRSRPPEEDATTKSPGSSGESGSR